MLTQIIVVTLFGILCGFLLDWLDNATSSK